MSSFSALQSKQINKPTPCFAPSGAVIKSTHSQACEFKSLGIISDLVVPQLMQVYVQTPSFEQVAASVTFPESQV